MTFQSPILLCLSAAMWPGLSSPSERSFAPGRPLHVSSPVCPLLATSRPESAPADEAPEKTSGTDLGIAISVVAGIALLGVLLIVLVLLWGVRLRRRSRQKTTEPTQHDPLWYLRTGKHRPKQGPEPSDAEEPPENKREPRPDDSD